MLTVALPKGRIADETLAIFKQVFHQEFHFDDRKLILKKDPFTFLKVRNQDVPTYVMNQAADVGVVGLDVLEEKSFDLMTLLDLKIGHCQIAIGVPTGKVLDYTKPEIKVATKMVNITKKYFAKKAMGIEIIHLYGSIELAPLVGLSDCIVDIVESGETMRQNNLYICENIMTSSAYLIANKNSFYAKKEEVLDLFHKISKILTLR
jgi:ATP phosphoribosyltransferase